MEAAYNTAWGWDDGAKRRELTDDAARFVLVRPKVAADADASAPPPPIAAYAHYRWEMEADGRPCLYVWEVQVADSCRRAGVGRFLMQLLELAARRAGVDAVTLTVMDCNTAALSLYASLGFSTDPGSPDAEVDGGPGYSILTKTLPAPPAAAGGAAAGVRPVLQATQAAVA
mgnify:CR=1 FL=1|jgi:GNAT superfamily N-acetyltransferase